MWKELGKSEVKKEWIITRPKPFQWSIDEIIRHMLVSEIRYIHQSFNPQAQQIAEAVPAQWVGDHFFRSEEGNYVILERLKELYQIIDKGTIKFLDSINEEYEKEVKAPWGEKMKFYELLEAFYDHELYHQGQVYFLLTFFRGVPNSIKSALKSKN